MMMSQRIYRPRRFVAAIFSSWVSTLPARKAPMCSCSTGSPMSRLKRDFPDVTVIICTGFSIDYHCQKALDEGAKDFIQKPFEPNTLAMKIRSVLDGR